MATENLTAERLREVIHYDPLTGIFVWRVKTSRRIVVGSVAGCMHKTLGYVYIRIDGVLHTAHRLATLYMTGEWPIEQVDHKDAVRSNNRWDNLRNADNALNMQNQRRSKGETKSGLLGVDWFEQTKKWRAAIKTNGQRVHIGYFATKEAAHEAYLIQKRLLHKFGTI